MFWFFFKTPISIIFHWINFYFLCPYCRACPYCRTPVNTPDKGDLLIKPYYLSRIIRLTQHAWQTQNLKWHAWRQRCQACNTPDKDTMPVLIDTRTVNGAKIHILIPLDHFFTVDEIWYNFSPMIWDRKVSTEGPKLIQNFLKNVRKHAVTIKYDVHYITNLPACSRGHRKGMGNFFTIFRLICWSDA